MDFLDADGSGHRTRLHHPGAGDAAEKFGEFGVVEDVEELGTLSPASAARWRMESLSRKQPGGGVPHAGEAQVLAEQGGEFDVEIVKGDDAVKHPGAREIADGVA